jgi:hypothetical protein
MGIVVDEVTLSRDFSEYLGPSALSIIPPVLILIFNLSTRDATKS